MTERKKSYCYDCNEWLFSDSCDCCPYHMKDGDYHNMDTPKMAKIISDLDYLEIEDRKEAK